MFNDAQKNEYAAIKAPARIKARLENTLARPRVTPQRWVAMAACLALVASVSVFSFQRLAPRAVTLSYMDAPVTERQVTVLGGEEEAVAFGAKTIVPSGIPLYVHAVRDTKISGSGGRIHIFGKDDALVSVGTDLTLNAPAEIRWDVSDLPTGRYTLTLAEQVYEVRIDAENGAMTIYKK